MAKRKKRRKSRNTRNETYPGWVWMLFGLSIGLAVAFAVYVKDSRPPAQTVAQPAPASMQGALDDNNETVARTPEPEPESEPKEKRFTFYDMLPAFEVVVPDETPNESNDTEPQAILEPGLYILQAGSFSTPTDADRRRAELALHGIESHVQRAKVNERNYYRVYIGPTDDLDELNLLRSRLRAAQIDVLRIRLGD